MKKIKEENLHPCIGVCSTTVGDEICRGCGRSITQIANWFIYSDEEKRKIIKEIKKRAN